MRATFLKSPSETSRVRPSLRFTLGDFEVRMCRVFVWPRLILPVPVWLKRFFAPVWVFNLGIFFSLSSRAGRTHPPCDRDFPALLRLQPVYRIGDFGAIQTDGAAQILFKSGKV